MPRGKKAVAAEPEAPQQEAAKPAIVADTDDNMVQRYLALKDWLANEVKRFKAHILPHESEMDAIENEFLKRFAERGQDASPTEHGTAYKSTLLNVSVSPEGPVYLRMDSTDAAADELKGRDALLEAALDHWGEWGSDMLMISAQKDAVKKYMEDHAGQPPPGVKTNFFVRVNIRRS